MPFEIVRNDITKMKVDAIVNTANPHAVIGTGVDRAIHTAAGEKLLQARQKIGDIPPGRSVATPAFDLPAKYVIHTVGPVWRGGSHNEEPTLYSCYHSALLEARRLRCRSVAFPLISAGNYGYPADLALQTALDCIRRTLMHFDMHVYLVLFGSETVALSQQLRLSVKSYIDENYVQEKYLEEYGSPQSCRPETEACIRFSIASLEDIQTDAGFSQTLMELIDARGLKDSVVYKKANVDRKLFSKIRSNPNYKPSKATALAFAIALELNLSQTRDLIGRAGYALTHSSKFDIIVEYFIVHRQYDIFAINSVLFDYDQPLMGGK